MGCGRNTSGTDWRQAEKQRDEYNGIISVILK